MPRYQPEPSVQFCSMNDRLSSDILFVGVDCPQPEIWPMEHQPSLAGGSSRIAKIMAPQGRSTKAASAPDLSNSTQGAKATAKDIQNALLLVSIQPAAGG